MEYSSYIFFAIFVVPVGYFMWTRVADWNRIKMKARLIHSLFTTMDKMVTIDSELKNNLSINDSGKSASLIYQKNGKEYLLNVPYSKHLLHRMANSRAVLIKANPDEEKGPVEIDITQQPGIPYLVTASELGGTHVEIRYNDGDIKHIGPHDHIKF